LERRFENCCMAFSCRIHKIFHFIPKYPAQHPLHNPLILPTFLFCHRRQPLYMPNKATVPATIAGHEVGIDSLVVHSVGPLDRRGKDAGCLISGFTSVHLGRSMRRIYTGRITLNFTSGTQHPICVKAPYGRHHHIGSIPMSKTSPDR